MKLAPSLLAADFGNLRAEAKQVEPFAAYFHIDVMDGHFVSNLTIGPPVVNSLRRGLSRPFDIHLMIDHPLTYAPRFDVCPDDFVSFHLEAKDDPKKVIGVIREAGAKVGIALRPATPLERVFPYLSIVDLVLVMSVEPGFGGQIFIPESIERLRSLYREVGDRPVLIAVDGGITTENIRLVSEAGAELVVVGSAIFGEANRLAAVRALNEAAK
jgi:ribulose-phosphate 3-epimerase